MEAPSDDSSPGWLVSGGDHPKATSAYCGSFEFEDWSESTGAVGDLPFQDLHSLGLDLSHHSPMDYVPNLDPPALNPGLSKETTTPTSPSDVVWTPSSAESFAGSYAASETLCLSPHLLSASPPLSFEAIHTDVSQISAGQIAGISFTSEQTSERTAFVALNTGYGPQLSPSDVSNTHKAHQKQSSRSCLRARERRRLERPVRCPICGKGHPYNAELKKHILSNHTDEAPAHGVSTERPVCELCHTSFRRRDHLLKHQTRKHGRPKTQRR